MSVVEGDQLREPGEDRVDVGALVAGQQEAEIRAIGGQHHAVAVEDQAAWRRRQLELEFVVLGEQAVAAGLDDLQLGQPGAKGRQAQSRQRPEHEGASLEQPLALVDVLEQERGVH